MQRINHHPAAVYPGTIATPAQLPDPAGRAAALPPAPIPEDGTAPGFHPLALWNSRAEIAAPKDRKEPSAE